PDGHLDAAAFPLPQPEQPVLGPPAHRQGPCHAASGPADTPGDGMSDGILVTAAGAVFRGRSVGAEGIATGEAGFNTSMTGYQESLTDPSYAGQAGGMPAPQQGNYGATAA